MHKTKKLSLILSFVLMLSTLFSVNALAASWPSLSSSGYCEFKAAKNMNVYYNSACTVRGTCSPAKKYDARIDKDDTCYIYKITSSYLQVNYPAGGTRRVGYIKRSDFSSVSSPANVVTSKGKATTYTVPGGKSYGSTAKNDKVYVCGTSGNYTAIIYTAESGKRDYKYGWVKTSDYNTIILGKPSEPSYNKSSASLADIATKEIGYTGKNAKGTGRGDYTKYGEWMKTNGTQWCASFVSWCANQAGISTKVIPKTADCDTMESKSNSYYKWNNNALKSLKKNDVIFFAKTGNLSDSFHVGIVTNVNASKGTISVIEGNTGAYYGPDIVKEITYTVNSKTGKITKGWDGCSFCGYISVN